MNDLARVVNQYLGDGRLSEKRGRAEAVDALLARYVEIQAAPEAFDGEAIGLALETQPLPDGSTAAHVALRMSPRLEGLIIEAQRQAARRRIDRESGRFRCDSPQALDFHRKLGYDCLFAYVLLNKRQPAGPDQGTESQACGQKHNQSTKLAAQNLRRAG